MQYGSDGGAPILYPNSPPKITGGGDHTMVIGSHITRSPMIDYNNPFQFNGELDDSLYQTITLRNIGPDTLFIDSVFIVDNITDTSSHPFYIQSLPDNFILFLAIPPLLRFIVFLIPQIKLTNRHSFIYIQRDGGKILLKS